MFPTRDDPSGEYRSNEAPDQKGTIMSEAVQFWLDNKMSTGIKVAVCEGQLLVLYRERYYPVENGAARMIGRKPLRYSKSSLPAIWKKALAGGAGDSPAVTDSPTADRATVAANNRTEENGAKMRRPERAPEEIEKQRPIPPPLRPSTGPKRAGKPVRPEKDPPEDGKVVARCPYCNNGHEIIPEKGRIGKPFFLECGRCKEEFAVRIVAVTVYRARVAGFR